AIRRGRRADRRRAASSCVDRSREGREQLSELVTMVRFRDHGDAEALSVMPFRRLRRREDDVRRSLALQNRFGSRYTTKDRLGLRVDHVGRKGHGDIDNGHVRPNAGTELNHLRAEARLTDVLVAEHRKTRTKRLPADATIVGKGHAHAITLRTKTRSA